VLFDPQPIVFALMAKTPIKNSFQPRDRIFVAHFRTCGHI
jgi:hypothetical protein